MEENYALNVGWKFPPFFNYHSNAVEMVRGLRAIKESLMILMRTRVGERIMEDDYGCDLTPLAFQPLDLNLETFMVNNIKQAIADHEPRVEVYQVQLTTPTDGEGVIAMHIRYKVRKWGIEDMLQYVYQP
ncbi:GPW/gp25 family protein [Candidatus Cardinium hertigii]|uniref:IraD/Gp25-like domain-containing protein n=1 Tax=Candidatus Cardinium hertigii TaxID=247481 RepID=A0A2Z3LGG4_9BACT|nr:GPW/gp25 family protein [Candidatus Cardinium hertigii]AWN81474.1 hypothetical protein DK880_00138 [Candidatus Cardinium hertigii]